MNEHIEWNMNFTWTLFASRTTAQRTRTTWHCVRDKLMSVEKILDSRFGCWTLDDASLFIHPHRSNCHFYLHHPNHHSLSLLRNLRSHCLVAITFRIQIFLAFSWFVYDSNHMPIDMQSGGHTSVHPLWFGCAHSINSRPILRYYFVRLCVMAWIHFGPPVMRMNQNWLVSSKKKQKKKTEKLNSWVKLTLALISAPIQHRCFRISMWFFSAAMCTQFSPEMSYKNSKLNKNW